MSDRTEAGRVVAALDVLLVAIESHRDQQELPTSIETLSIAQLRQRSPIESLLSDPIGRGLRLAIKELGKRLNDLGGFDLMSRVADTVAGNVRATADGDFRLSTTRSTELEVGLLKGS